MPTLYFRLISRTFGPCSTGKLKVRKEEWSFQSSGDTAAEGVGHAVNLNTMYVGATLAALVDNLFNSSGKGERIDRQTCR